MNYELLEHHLFDMCTKSGYTLHFRPPTYLEGHINLFPKSAVSILQRAREHIEIVAQILKKNLLLVKFLPQNL